MDRRSVEQRGAELGSSGRRKVLALAFAVSLGGCGDGITTPPLADPGVQAFVELVNQHRVQVGCEPLAWHADVAEVALAHSADMVARDFFAHTNPDGENPFDRLTNAGIDYSAAAENIAYGYPDAPSVLQAWLDSPGHRSNIENCGLREHGVGLVGTHWTHLFVTTP